MAKKHLALLALCSLFGLSACDEGAGINMPLSSKNKDADSGQAVSVNVDGQNVSVTSVASEAQILGDGSKLTTRSEETVMINQASTGTTFPPAFAGKWAAFGEIANNTSVTEDEARKICNTDDDYLEKAWIVSFNSSNHIIENIYYYEDRNEIQPIKYTLNQPNQISGTALEKEYELGDPNPVKVQEIEFGYTIQGNKLYYSKRLNGNTDVTVFLRCNS